MNLGKRRKRLMTIWTIIIVALAIYFAIDAFFFQRESKVFKEIGINIRDYYIMDFTFEKLIYLIAEIFIVSIMIFSFFKSGVYRGIIRVRALIALLFGTIFVQTYLGIFGLYRSELMAKLYLCGGKLFKLTDILFHGGGTQTAVRILYLAIFFFAFLIITSIGNKDFKKTEDSRELTTQECNTSGISSILANASKYGIDTSGMAIRILSSDSGYGAYTYNSRSITLDPSTLKLDKEQLGYIVSHELGHISNGDHISEGIVYTTLTLFLLPFIILSWILSALGRINGVFAIFSWINMVLYKIASLVVAIIHKVEYVLGGRFDEINADRFAIDIGYAKGALINLRNELDADLPWYKKIFDPHPGSKGRYRKALQHVRDNNYISEEILKQSGFMDADARR